MADARIALLVIDMQIGGFVEARLHPPLDDVVERINALSRALRAAGGPVIFIQHDGPEGDPFAPGAPGWALIPGLVRETGDAVVHKTACDAFYETDLGTRLETAGVEALWITGTATDFCVDTTVRAAASRDFEVTVAKDAHLTRDRDHIDAESIIRHAHYVWEGLLLPRSRVRVIETQALIDGLEAR